MKKTVLTALIAAAGLAASVNAQTPVFELQLVVDGAPGSPFTGGSNFFPNGSLGSNAIPTAIGITVRARVTTTGTTANWGIGRAGFSAAGSGLSFITHNDTLTNTTNGTFWSAGDVATSAFRRGATGDGPNIGTNPRVGLFNFFRNGVATTANLPTGNGTFVNPFNNGLIQRGTPGGTNGTVWSANAAGFAGIVGSDGAFAQQTSTNGLASLIAPTTSNPNVSGTNSAGLGRQGATASDTVTSPWENIYRFLFIPRTNNSDPFREVRISAFYKLDYANDFTDTNGDGTGSWFKVSNLTAGNRGQASASLTINVPTPGAVAVLGLGGLTLARRRRTA